MSSQEGHRDRAQRYLAMAETNGLRLLAAAYMEKAAKEEDQQQQPGGPERTEGPAD